MQAVTLTTAQMQDLQERLRALPDRRARRGKRHPQAAELSIGLAAVLAGNRGYTALAEWAARLTQPQLKRLHAPRTERFEPPCEPTLRRVLQTSDTAAVDALLSEWLLGVASADQAVAVDGKVLRGAVRADGTQVQLLSAFLHYFFTVKENQPTLYADRSALTEAHFPPVRRNPG